MCLYTIPLLLLLLISLLPAPATATAPVNHASPEYLSVSDSNSENARNTLFSDNSHMLIVSTLDGLLHGVDQKTGSLAWSLSDGGGALVRTSASEKFKDLKGNSDTSNCLDINGSHCEHSGNIQESRSQASSTFVTEPSDAGNLYTFTPGEPMTKLSLSIRQLVEMSPFRTDDGTLYIGSKKTFFYNLDMQTGQLLSKFAISLDRICPLTAASPLTDSPNSIFLGKTDYKLLIYDSDANIRYNVSFSTFTTPFDTLALPNKDLSIRVSTDGTLSISNRHTLQFKSPVVSVFSLDRLHSNTHLSRVFPLSPNTAPSSSTSPSSAPPPKAWIGSIDQTIYAMSSDYFGDLIPPLRPPPAFLPSKLHSSPTTIPQIENPDSNSKDLMIATPQDLVAKFSESIGEQVDVWDGRQYRDHFLNAHGKEPSLIPLLPPSQDEVGEGSKGWLGIVLGVFVGAIGVLVLVWVRRLTRPNSAAAGPFAKKKKKRKSKKADGNTAESEDENFALPVSKELLHITASTNIASDGSTSIKSLVITPHVLGYGSHGTIVYKGSFEDRPVAVKRLLVEFWDVAQKEILLLQHADDHPNVIRYFCKEVTDRFCFIALEVCWGSLSDLVEVQSLRRIGTNDENRVVASNSSGKEVAELVTDLDVVPLLKQAAQGLAYLHSLKIVHRDIKPQNILISQTKEGGFKALISDFGLCKKLESNQSSFHQTMVSNGTNGHGGPMGGAGTVGWRSPECLLDGRGGTLAASIGLSEPPTRSGSSVSFDDDVSPLDSTRQKVSRSMDVFGLGCVYYFVLTGGHHPYGDRFDRERNIVKNLKDLSLLENLDACKEEAKDLVDSMTKFNPKDRPSTLQILTHPFFWSPSQKLSFLQDVSDRFEIEEKDPPSLTLSLLEKNARPGIVSWDWTKRLDRVLINDLGKYRKYDGGSLRDLLRVIRNKKNHYQDLSDPLKRTLGPLPNGFLTYFITRFPKLLVHSYHVIRDNQALRDEDMFRQYIAV